MFKFKAICKRLGVPIAAEKGIAINALRKVFQH
jgi:hypothetical protein